MKDVLVEDRPYEKLEQHGAERLSDSELLAIIIKSGTKEMNSLKLAQILLSKKDSGLDSFNYLDNISIEELKMFKGIGRVKAIQIKAVIEIAKRISKNSKEKIRKIKCPKDVYDLLSKDMENKQVEALKVVILNNKNNVKSVVTVSLGSQNRASVGIKEILYEPLKQMASSIIIVHNHPSGDSSPSKQDILFTKKIIEGIRTFDIELLDHIVIGKNEYTSIKEINSSIFNEGRRILWVFWQKI